MGNYSSSIAAFPSDLKLFTINWALLYWKLYLFTWWVCNVQPCRVAHRLAYYL